MDVRAGKRLVIVNPNAARLRDAPRRRELVREVATTLERHDGVAPEIIETASSGEPAPVIAAALASGIAGVVVVGGDGTLRDVAAMLTDSDVSLGVVPVGTGNQLASALGIPRDPRRAIAGLPTARPRAIDLGAVRLELVDRPPTSGVFTIGCGIGFDARVMASTPQAWKRRVGTLAYFVQAVRLALSIDVQPYRIEIDGRVIETEASVALVGNLGQLVPGLVGPRIPIEPDDGRLDLLVAGARNPLAGLRVLADQLLRTELAGESGSASLRLRGRRIAIRTERPEAVEIDGDHVGTGSLVARVLPAVLRILVPAA